jgi:hypothetical protein
MIFFTELFVATYFWPAAMPITPQRSHTSNEQEMVSEPMDVGNEKDGKHELVFRLPNNHPTNISTL